MISAFDAIQQALDAQNNMILPALEVILCLSPIIIFGIIVCIIEFAKVDSMHKENLRMIKK